MHRQFAMSPWQWKCEHTENDGNIYSWSNLASESSCSYNQPTIYTSNHSTDPTKWNPCSSGGRPYFTNIHPLNKSDSRAVSFPDLSHLLHWQCHHYLNNRIFPNSEENSAQHCAAAARSLWLGGGHPQYGLMYRLPSNPTMEIGTVRSFILLFIISFNQTSFQDRVPTEFISFRHVANGLHSEPASPDDQQNQGHQTVCKHNNQVQKNRWKDWKS